MIPYLITLNNAIELANGLKNILNKEKISVKNTLFYSYWFFHHALVLAILRHKSMIKYFVSRCHQADVYKNNKLTFQYFKINNVSKLFAISKHAKDYLDNKFPVSENTCEVSYLGVQDRGVNKLTDSKGFTMVSCSKFALHKRIFLIPEILKHITFPLLWVHFGSSGQKDIEKVEQSLKMLPQNIKVELKGFTENQKIIEFYRRRPVNLFINISSKEGLSVAMMEALSFGIPLIGTDINATSEIVTKETGFLIPIDFDPEQVAGIISNFKKTNQHKFRLGARDHYKKKFNADKNYSQFVQQLAVL